MGKITRQELHTSLRAELDSVRDYIDGSNNEAVGQHMADMNNPHSTTKAQVGLGSVDNVKQASLSAFNTHLNNPNPHNITTDKIGAVPTGRSIVAGTGLTGGGALTTSRALNFDRSWGDNRYLLRTASNNFTGTLIGGTVRSRLEHSNGYFNMQAFNASYNTGWYFESYWDGDNLRVTKRSSHSHRSTRDMDIYLNGARVHSTRSIRYGTGNPSGGSSGDIYVQY